MRSLEEYLKAVPVGKRVLNLGCGFNNPTQTFGVDIQALEGVDLVADCNEPIPLPDNTFDVVFAQDFLEHIDQKKNIQLMEEIYRVLDFGGQLVFDVPSTDGNNQGAFCDPTHVSFWNILKFKYFMDDSYTEGQRSLYNIKCHFHPRELLTYNNKWNCTYVRGTLQKVLK